MAKVYLETTIPSYLTARPSRDLLIAAHQQVTLMWWDQRRKDHELFVSELVVQESQRGDQEYASKRLEVVKGLTVLRMSDDVVSLIGIYEASLGLSGDVRSDVTHIAMAVSYDMDFLLTWNCKHIANGRVVARLSKLNHELGRRTPIVVTPDWMIE